MWIHLRLVSGGEVISTRCADAAQAVAKLIELGKAECFFAVDLNGSVLSQLQVEARAVSEATGAATGSRAGPGQA